MSNKAITAVWAAANRPHRRVSIHEAGHAVAYWWNGQGIYCAVARAKAEECAGPYIDRRGRENNASGIVEASSFISSPELTTQQYGAEIDNQLFQESVARDLLHCFSGPVAEAIYRRESLVNILFSCGWGDMQHARALLKLLPDDEQPKAERLAIARCRELVRRHWNAVLALADLLQEQGRVEGDDVKALLCSVTGESPKYCGNALEALDKRGAKRELTTQAGGVS